MPSESGQHTKTWEIKNFYYLRPLMFDVIQQYKTEMAYLYLRIIFIHTPIIAIPVMIQIVFHTANNNVTCLRLLKIFQYLPHFSLYFRKNILT